MGPTVPEGHDNSGPSDNLQPENGRRDEGGNMGDVLTELILEFQAVTGMEDMDESRRILEANDWDLLQAISSQMGFEQLPPQQYDPGNQPHRAANADVRTPVVVQDDSLIRAEGRGYMENGNGNNSPGIFGWVWKLISAPVNLMFRYLWELIGFGLRFLRQDARRAITDPVQDVVNFISSYESMYGRDHPVFYQGTYGQALTDAKRELKFLLVYLHSEDHGNTDEFCRVVMTNQNFRDFVRENMLFWGCTVSCPEGYRTSQALRENAYPFLALIVLKNNRMTIVARIEGETNPETLLARLHQAVADNEAYLIAERHERSERSMTQTIRQQQDAAYNESLRADQEKERRKKEELERKRLENEEKQRQADEEIRRREELKQQKVKAGAELKPEPNISDTDVIQVVIKLPNGTRLKRRFRKSDSLKHLYLFVFSHGEAPDFFEIAKNFPKKTLTCKPTNENPDPPTFIESGIECNEMLFVYDLES